MRNEKEMLNSFMPLHEKEWEARLFIDSAIKNKSEYTLEAIARALSGKKKLSLRYCEDKKPFEFTEHLQGDGEGNVWIKQTRQYRIQMKMEEYCFFGNNMIEIWLKIIDFWAGKVSIFPCGGAGFPNEKVTCDEHEFKTLNHDPQTPQPSNDFTT